MEKNVPIRNQQARPAVSICCLAYNHETYIRDALDSFLMQKTTFPIEILIHDDASTDKTADIIREYEKRYPDVVKPIYQKENQYSKGVKNISGIFNFPRAEGRYIAMCEGDDYWIDPGKLEKQVSYLEAHPDCTLCFHSARQVTVDGSITDGYMRPYRGSRRVEPEDIIDKTSGYAMNSMVFPAEIVKKPPDYYWNCPIGDIPMQLMMASKGWAYYMDETMSVYRVGVNGSWTEMMKSGDYEKKQKEYSRQMKQMYEEFDRETGGKFHQEAVHAAKRIEFLTKVNTKHYDEVFARENREFYQELNFRTRFFIQLEVFSPRLYRWLQKKATGR
ncbi:glycosyltransferase [Lachnospiraceae bacterium 62-35]